MYATSLLHRTFVLLILLRIARLTPTHKQMTQSRLSDMRIVRYSLDPNKQRDLPSHFSDSFSFFTSSYRDVITVKEKKNLIAIQHGTI
jgi:uncharacterized membrane-anchored protein YhcB (DUF1043 family)